MIKDLNATNNESFEKLPDAIAEMNELLRLRSLIFPKPTLSPDKFDELKQQIDALIQQARNELESLASDDCNAADAESKSNSKRDNYINYQLEILARIGTTLGLDSGDHSKASDILFDIGFDQQEKCDEARSKATTYLEQQYSASTSKMSNLISDAQQATKTYNTKIRELIDLIDTKSGRIEMINAESRLVIEQLSVLVSIILIAGLLFFAGARLFEPDVQKAWIESRQLLELLTSVALLSVALALGLSKIMEGAALGTLLGIVAGHVLTQSARAAVSASKSVAGQKSEQ